MPPIESEATVKLAEPDYLPARMINEFVYCPRLFHFEQVLGVFVHNQYTVEGANQHKRVDKEAHKSAPRPTDVAESPVVIRSMTLSSEQHRVIAKLDLASFKDGMATPIDYKRGAPRRSGDRNTAWPSDEVQLAIQALVLRDNGYQCNEGVIYYHRTKQRVRLPINESMIDSAIEVIEQAWSAVTETRLPPPLVDSPKCPGCSLVGVCLPDETWWYLNEEQGNTVQPSLFEPDRTRDKPPKVNPRLLTAPRVDQRPLYLNTHGLRVGKSGDILTVRGRGKKVVKEVRINDICQVNLLGNIQITTQAVQALCRAEKPICYFSYGGWFYGITTGMNTKNVVLRKTQTISSDWAWFRLIIARSVISGKIRNQRTLLMRNHPEPSEYVVDKLKQLASKAQYAQSEEKLLGFEGFAARIYFGSFGGMIKRGPRQDENSKFAFDFKSRNRRPPRDPVNALLSYGYSLLTKDLTVACYAVGLDPMLGFFHHPRHGRPALALDLMEPLRPLIVDSAVLSAVNTKMVRGRHVVTAGRAVAMTEKGRKAFLRAYEGRMDTLVTHPQLGYRVTYRRLLEIQARLLAKVLDGELHEYPAFVTR